VGIRSAQQAKGISGAASLELSADDVAEIDHQLVPEAA
jgi:aryl-alcohol dehydrogenase-like predicted oxidoreductase